MRIFDLIEYMNKNVLVNAVKVIIVVVMMINVVKVKIVVVIMIENVVDTKIVVVMMITIVVTSTP